MKKIFTLLTILALTTSVSFANSFTNAVKTDFRNAKNDVKSAVKADVNNAKQQHNNAAAAKKAEKLKQINSKLEELNKEYNTVKNQKYGITESERSLRLNVLQRQIDFYNKQKAALK